MWNINTITSDSLVTLSLTIIALIAVSWRYYQRRRNIILAKGHLLPGPRGIPILGYLPFLGQDLHRQFTSLAGIHGPIFKLWLGNKLFVVVTSPEIVREIAREKDVVFANHELTVAGAISTKGGKDIAFSPHSRVWRKLRRIFVQQVMSAVAIEGLRRQRSEAVRESVQRLHRSSSGEGVDVGHVAFLTSANSVLSMMWGGSMKAVQEGAKELRRAVWDILFMVGKPNVSDVFPSLAWLDLQGIGRETARLTEVFERMFDSAIEKRRKNVNALAGGVDFLQFLLEFVDDDKGEDSETSITMDQLKAILMDPVVGGTQTTSTVVEWAMAELLKNGEIMQKAQDELAQVVGLTNMVEESHLSKLTYLQAVIKETLRLHPPFPLMVPRFPSENTSLGGFTIPKNATIFVNTWAIHRNPSVWEDPLKFKPERFLVENPNGKLDYNGNNDFNYIPFGVGRRICPGIPMAEKMVPLALASFLHCFNWKLPPCTDPLKLDFSDKFGLVTTILKPVIAIPTPRLLDLDLYA